MLSNCILYARALHRRLAKRGHRVYRSKRPSDWGDFNHHLVHILRPSGRIRVVSYKPIDPRVRKKPPILFRGRVVWGDPPPSPPRKRKLCFLQRVLLVPFLALGCVAWLWCAMFFFVLLLAVAGDPK